MQFFYSNLKTKDYCKTDCVTILATPSELKRLSKFISRCAEIMEIHGENFGHEHLQDFERNDLSRMPDLIVGKLKE